MLCERSPCGSESGSDEQCRQLGLDAGERIGARVRAPAGAPAPRARTAGGERGVAGAGCRIVARAPQPGHGEVSVSVVREHAAGAPGRKRARAPETFLFFFFVFFFWREIERQQTTTSANLSFCVLAQFTP